MYKGVVWLLSCNGAAVEAVWARCSCRGFLLSSPVTGRPCGDRCTAAELCAKLAEVGASFGLQVQGYGHKGNSSIKRLGGQMLQIFIHKSPWLGAEIF